MRIEDTDLERSSKESEINIFESLAWLGLEADESVQVGGPYGPYRQTERLDIYKQYADQLLAEGKAYYCFCSEEEIEAERAAAMEKRRNAHVQRKMSQFNKGTAGGTVGAG